MKGRIMFKSITFVVLLLFGSMLFCPVLAAVVPILSEDNCGHEDQRNPGQQMKNCCDQQAVQTKDIRFLSVSSLLCVLETGEVDSIDLNYQIPLSCQVFRYSKTSKSLAALSILRI